MMNPQTLIKDLTETQILSAIREEFDGKRVADIATSELIASSTRLLDLFASIQSALDQEEETSTSNGMSEYKT